MTGRFFYLFNFYDGSLINFKRKYKAIINIMLNAVSKLLVAAIFKKHSLIPSIDLIKLLNRKTHLF